MMTIGHSTLELNSFLRALRENGCTTLVDVRRFPGSRRHPQFGQDRLFAALGEAEIRAIWREGLGGRREVSKDSVNTGWKNESFRGYADYMQTDHFANEIEWLMALADFDSAVVMCAEAVPWRCHRSLIGDAVLARGGVVEDIFVDAEGRSSRKSHAMTEFARVEGEQGLVSGGDEFVWVGMFAEQACDWVHNDAAYDSLHSDSRYRSIIQRVGLVWFWRRYRRQLKAMAYLF